jgi:heat-inducible transcriptional repressor
MELDKRAQSLLQMLVKLHVSDGQPVGSKTLSASSELEISPATIRNIMHDLEEAGFIASPHTSAGRVPTHKGYRFFVDSLVTVQSLDPKEIDNLKNQFNLSNNKHLITSVANSLSDLTKFAGVVMLPKAKKVKFKHIEFLSLSEKKVLLIVVTDDGRVQNRVLYTNKSYPKNLLVESSNYFNHHFQGHTILEAKQILIKELKTLRSDIVQLMSAAIDTSSENGELDNMVISGQRKLLENTELSQNIGSIKKIVEVFEQRSALLDLLEKSNDAKGINIFIGEESGYQALDECSVVTAPYHADGELLGMLGVIGPTRMAYERIIPIVDITAKLLGNSFK